MSPFPALEDKTVIDGQKVRTRTAFPGLTPAQPRAFDEADVRKMLETSRELGVAPDQMEPYWESLKFEYDLFGRVDPSDPFAVKRAPATDNRIGVIEQIARMDAVDWTSRIPFSPTGALASLDLMAAARRIQKDVYEGEFRAEFEKAESPEGRMQRLPGKPTVIALPAERRQQDLDRIESFLLKRQELAERGMTWGAKVFDGVSYLPAWMIEFALTGGLAKLGSESARQIGMKTLQGYAKTSGGRAVLKAAGWTGAQITRSTLGMPHRLADEILERRVDQIALEDGKIVQVDPESWATSIWKGWAANLIEVASESAGEGMVKGGAWIGRNTLAKMPLGSRLYEGLRRAYVATHPAAGAADEFAARFFDAAKFDGLLGEMGEERLATILHAIVGTEDFGLGPDTGPLERLKKGLADDIKNLSVEAAVLAVPGGVKMALDARGRVRDAKTPPATEEAPTVPTEGDTLGLAEKTGQIPVSKPIVEDVRDETGVGRDEPSPTRKRPGETKQPWEMMGQEFLKERIAPALHDLQRKLQFNPTSVVSITPEGLIENGGGEILLSHSLELPGTHADDLTGAAIGFAIQNGEIREIKYRKPDGQERWAYAFTHTPETEADAIVSGGFFADRRFSPEKALEEFARRKEMYDLGQQEIIGGANWKTQHRRIVREALERGEDVPTAVLRDMSRFDLWAKEELARREASFNPSAGPSTPGAQTPSEKPPVRLVEAREGEGVPTGRETVPQAGEQGQAITLQQIAEAVANERPEGLVARFEAARPDLAEVHRQFRTWSWGRLPPAIRRRLKALGEESIEEPVTEETPFEDLSPAAKERFAIEHAVNQAFGIDTTEPTEQEIRDQVQEQAAGEAIEAVRDYFGEPDPADLPTQEPPAEDIGLLKRIWQRFAGPDVEILSDKDFRDIWRFLQLPGDIARSFPQFRPVYEIQRAREVAKQTLDRYFGEKLRPYFDLPRREQLEVDRVLVMMEQNLTGIQSHLDALSKPQYTAYTAVRKALDEAAEMLIAYMKKMGVREKWIEQFRGRIGFYIPHKWYGKYRVIAKEGKRTIDMAGVDSKGDVQQHLDRMHAAHPEAKVFAIEATKMPMDAYQDVSYQGIVQMMDRVVEETNKKMGAQKGLTEDQKTVINQAWADMWKEKGFGMHFIQRAETPGWTEDLRKPILEYFSGFAGYVTKMEACQQFPDGLAKINASRTPQLYKYASEYVRYLTGQESGAVSTVSRATKNVLFHWYLYGNLKSAAVNLTQNHVLGWPVLSKLTKWPLAKMLVHQARTAAGQLTADEKTFLTQLEASGALDPKFATELRSFGGNAVYRAAWKKGDKVYDLFDFFSKVEQFNRRAMAVALYHADPSLWTDLKRAGELIEEAHFRFSKGNRPTLWRGALSPFMTFRSYTVNYLTWLKNEVKEGRIGPAAKSMAALTFYGGLVGTPFGMAIGAIWRWLFQSDPEGDMREAIGDLAEAITIDRQTGEKVSDVLMRGAPSVLGVSLTGSLAINGIIPEFGADVDPEEAVREWMLGVIGGIPQRANRVSASMRAGDTLRALEDASPEFLRNPLAAIRMYRQGAATRSGRPIIDHEFHRQMKLTESEAILKSLGFQPDRLDKQYQIKMYLDEIYAKKQALKAQWADRLILSTRTQDFEGIREILDEMDQYNRKMESRNRPDLKIATKEMDAMLNIRTKPVGLPSESMLETYGRIWKQYYGKEQP